MKKRTKLLRKILSVALATSVIASVTATVPLSVSAWAVIEDDFGNITDHEIYVQGNFYGDEFVDAASLTDEDGDGVYLGVVKNVPEGEHDFFIHLDDSTKYSWGTMGDNGEYLNTFWYESVEVDITSDVLIIFDTTKSEDPNYWSVGSVVLVNKGNDSQYDTSNRTFSVKIHEDDYNDANQFAMTDIGGGIYAANIGETVDVKTFEVVADDSNDYWGAYNESNNRTYYSEKPVTISGMYENIIVIFDTNLSNYQLWPVYVLYTDDGYTCYKYTGKTVDDNYHIILGNHITWEISDNKLIMGTSKNPL